MSDAAKWYVVHTYSGYENKVASSIEKAVENRKLHDLIQAVNIPHRDLPCWLYHLIKVGSLSADPVQFFVHPM